ncbi:hypothetical protein ACSBR2_020199 [Camellia fascicularis]
MIADPPDPNICHHGGCYLFNHHCHKVTTAATKHSFLKKFYGCVTKSDYIVLRLGFVMTHCRGNPKFNFHKYMIRALEDDFKKVVGIRQAIAGISCANCTASYLFFCVRWIFVVVFLLLNLLLAVGTKLEHVITQLAHEVAEKHIAVEGELVVQPSDNHFWFHRPPIVLFLMHFILFQNAFEITFFFWIWLQYGFDSCRMGHVRFIIPRLVIGVFVQVLCSYSTLPLYAIVTQTPNSPIAAGSSGGRKTSNRIILVCHGSSQSGSEKHFLGIIRIDVMVLLFRTFGGVFKNAAYTNITTFLKRHKAIATAASSTFGAKRRKRSLRRF